MEANGAAIAVAAPGATLTQAITNAETGGKDGVGAGEEEEGNNKKKCCNGLRFGGNREAQGYSLMTVARGGIIMSNIFLSAALIRLASESAGCIFNDDGSDEETPECNEEVFGFRPSSLITMIAVVSGVLSAFLLPIIGAVVDYTPHRRLVGILSALFITVVQGIQIWLNDTTWFPMAILQALNGFMYMVQVLAVYAYLPDIGREVGARKMTWFSALFTMCQFGAQSTFLVVNIALSIALGTGDVVTAQISQGICVLWLIVTFVPGWKKMPSVPALHERTSGSLVRLGFSKNWQTMVGINTHYGSGLRWYFLAVVFAEAGANAFTVVAVTFMVEVLSMTGTEVGIVFLVTLVSTIPGSKLGEIISKKTTPITSWKINLVTFMAITAVGSFVLTGPDRKSICYVFGVLWGSMLGWFYPLENVIFAMSIPKGQESELSGFYTYCRSILTWLPPLIFTVMNESGIDMKWGLLSLVIFLFIGLIFLQLMLPWDEFVAEAKKQNMMMFQPETVDGADKSDDFEE
ncbi:hypothetical protein ACHAXR_012126 [Thalassiosira sp. AJA248-18]